MNASLIRPARPRPSARAALWTARGFTLIELMVALTGGLIFSVFVFMLARDSARFYQRESRLSDATFGALAGFQRLRTDIARAGFLSVANIRTSPSFCGNAAGLPGELANLASLRLVVGGSLAGSPTFFNDNGLNPDAIYLMGSYDSVDQFPIRAVFPAAGGFEVHLQPNSPAMQRLITRGGTVAGVFRKGRALRIVDKAGNQQFGIISDPAPVNALDPYVVLAPAPVLQQKASDNRCGLRGSESGSLVNVVQIIRYDLRSLDGTNEYDPIYANQDAEGEANRTELVRTEVDFANIDAPLEGTTPELVAEYAVDLKFGLIGVTNAALNTTGEIPEASLANYAGDPTVAPGPAAIRAVRARLSVRSRAPDREAATLAAGVAAGLYRVNVGTPATPQFARVRTLQADIALRNQASAR
jgi:prepilin-type N-terminal cleavage/methylation domain-containing protein